MSSRNKPLVWLRGEIKTPPFGPDARVETGFLLRRLQRGEGLGLPHSRPMPGIGVGCHELRIVDGSVNWRIMYHIAPDAIVILDVFQKKTSTTPTAVIADSRRRLAEFQRVVKGRKGSGPCASINAEGSNGPGGRSAMPATSWASPPTSAASSQ